MARDFSEHEEREIAARYVAGESVQTIGAALNRAPGTVHRVLIRRGVQTRSNGGRPRRLLSAEEKAICSSRYQEGASIPKIARELSCGVGPVSDALAELGVARRRRGGQPKLGQEKREAILTLWTEGLSATAIAARLGSGMGTVKSVLEQANIPWENRLKRGTESPAWKGGRVSYGPEVNGSRYVAVAVAMADQMRTMAFADGYVPEHRLVMARAISRPLAKYETVHHKNGIRDDNRLENLQLRTGRHGKGVAMRCVDCGSSNIEATELA
jgi:transposase